MYVTAYGTYGHTALVHNVNGAYVDVLEQNGSCRCVVALCSFSADFPLSPERCSGAATYSIAGAECFLRSS